MPLVPGAHLGPYEILSLLGAGGMGEVYRARDAKLNRDVALKVLPDSFATDSDRLARFKREAQVLASLNHQNIAAIYGFEESSGISALVLELVEGPTLADRITQGPIPIDDALPVARQIADALEAAHEQGIIHRDLKPANIKLKADGTVKVLDFGLAKALSPVEAGHHDSPGAMSQSPTITSPAMTRLGVIMGTAAYMALEQAKGKPVDKRADVWAFGCVLFEMLTGKLTFRGDDVSDIVVAILRDQPDWSALPAQIPPGIRRLLLRCLEKDPRLRLRDIGEARIAIDMKADASVSSGPRIVPSTLRRVLPWAAGISVGLVIGVLAAWSLSSRPPATPAPVQRLSISLPAAAPLSFQNLGVVRLALSPDGTRLAYVADTGGRPMLYVRRLSEREARPLGGAENASWPFFSPDGETVGFTSVGRLMKVSIQGGSPVTLSAAANSTSTWTDENQVIFAKQPEAGGPSRLFSISASGGTARELPSRKGDLHYLNPQALPGGEAVIFQISRQGVLSGQIAVMAITTGEISLIAEDGSLPRYVSSGHVVYLRQSTLLAVPFDVTRLMATGPAVPAVEGITPNFFAVSENGLLAYARALSDDVAGTSLVWVDRAGRPAPALADRAAYGYPRISPDGRQVAVGIGNEIWAIDLLRGGRVPLTRGDRLQGGPSVAITAWTPDGKVTFSGTLPPNEYLLQRISADGTGETERLYSIPGRIVQPGSWSRDGRFLAFYLAGPAAGPDRDLLIWRADERKAEPFVSSRFREVAPRFSPDGRWIAYVSDTSGRDEVYLLRFPERTNLLPVSTTGGTEPVWSVDGRELFYRNGNQMMSVSITSGVNLGLSQPRRLFEAEYRRDSSTSIAVPNYDVAKDGRFLMIQGPTSQSPGVELSVVVNWGEELKKIAPAKP